MTGPRRQRPCVHWIAAESRYCRATETRLYLVGHKCADHTPSAIAGKPEPDDLLALTKENA
jgi:hypothetical protein